MAWSETTEPLAPKLMGERWATIEEAHRMVAPFSKEALFSVVIFVVQDCPIANAYAPEFSRLFERARVLGGQCTFVHVDWDLSREDAVAHAEDYALPAEAIVIDRDHRLVNAVSAEITPEAVVVLSGGSLAYRGRVSDLFTDYGDRRRVVRSHDLRKAMDRAAQGTVTSENEWNPAVGCLIPKKE
ncbi:MAG: hypothetical protein AAGJ31_02205 [Verrucomicrobiota bacterium]